MATIQQEQYGVIFALVGGMLGAFLAMIIWFLTVYELLGLTMISLFLGGVAFMLGGLVGVLLGIVIGTEQAKPSKRR